MDIKTRAILALDVTNREDALRIGKDVSEFVDAIKVGYPLLLATGLCIIKDLAQYSPIIADLKIADIPNTNRLICEQVFKAGADAVIVHGFTGRDSLDACIDVASEYKKDVFVVAEMSHCGAVEFMQQHTKGIVKMAHEAGAIGVVAPATRLESLIRIRKIAGDLVIISPGVGAQGGNAADTLAAGATYIIVGRSVYESDNPKEAIQKIMGCT